MADLPRSSLPIPDRKPVGLVTFDAKDPDTSFPPIETLLPPAGAPNVLIVLLDDIGFGASSAFGGPCQTPRRRTARRERPQVLALPHDGALLSDARCAPVRAQPSHRRHGRHHRDRHVGAGLQLVAAQHVRAATRDASAERLLDRAVRQMPRGARVGDEPDGTVRPLAAPGRRVRVLLRLHRRRDEPVLPRAVRRHGADRDAEVSGGGVSPHRGHRRQGDHMGATAEGAHAGSSVLRLLRARERRMLPITSPPTGQRSTRASSTKGGTRSATRRSLDRRHSA